MTGVPPINDVDQFPGTILMGAQSRLLPYRIPLRFFVAAAVFHLAAWVLLATGHQEVTWFVGGPGLALAALHALTLGVLVMTAMGASLQLLTVATGVALNSLVPVEIATWTFIPATAVLIAGMTLGDTMLMAIGGVVTVGALLLFSWVLADIFRRSLSLKHVIAHGWAALACLLLLGLTGLGLIFDFDYGFLGEGYWPGHTGTGIAHAILGAFGFMGLLALGFSYVLVPMFALSGAPNRKAVKAALVLVITALLVGATGALSGHGPAVAVGVLLGLAGIGLHLGLMVRSLRDGMKKRLGLSFVMVRGAWMLLPLALFLASLAAIADWDINMAGIAGFLLVFGWLLTFLIGILQSILPFLASMHAHNLRLRPPRLADMGHPRITLRGHAACHGIALMAVTIGMMVDDEILILAGGGVGTLGALFFLWFSLGVAWHLARFHARAVDEPNP
ncbi:MAG: hypothetical protein MI741_13930 [Rhodospirillales bacterium]|nr:hypothetical protein [Rhodospirillales bacterium]